MELLTPRIVSLRRIGILSCTALGLFVFGGCAAMPELEYHSDMKSVDRYASKDSLSVSTHTQWPDDAWWKSYDDPQLDGLIAEALKDSPDIQAASGRFRTARSYAGIADSALYPQLYANGSVSEQKLSYNNLMPRNMLPNGWNDYGQATLNVNWEIDFWGKNRAALAEATSTLEARRAELAFSRLMIVSAVASAYAELDRLYADHDQLEHALNNCTNIKTLLQERMNNGLENEGAIEAAKSKVAKAKESLLLCEELMVLQRHRIAALMGAGPDRGDAIRRPSLSVSQTAVALPESMELDLLGRRPDVTAAKMEVYACLHRIDRKKAEFYPNVNLSAFIGVQSLGINMLGKNGSDFGGVGPAVSLPIFTAGRLQNELKASASQYDEAVAGYNKTVSNALQQVADAVSSQRLLNVQIGQSREAVDSAAKAYETLLVRYRGGLSNYLEVLYAQENLIVAERSLSTLRNKRLTLDIALKYALGGGYNPTKMNNTVGETDVRK
ncbi:MAG: efflux transporter outer membrane subunit [Sulfuricurvum sp.]